mgnify:CR=1 FL=1
MSAKHPKVWSEIRGKMVSPHVAMYWRKREALVQDMGGKCAMCGTANGLEFDHIHGITWTAMRVSSHQRIKRYRDEWKAGGILQLLCGPCNKVKGKKAPPPSEHSTDEGEPF